MHDVAIIGAGPAGLATAHRLEQAGHSVVVLEETERTGGRALTVDVGGEAVNLGAMFVYSGTQSHRLAVELGIPLVPFEPTSFGIHVGGTTVVARDNAALVAELPLPAASRRALAEFLERARQEYFANTADGQLRPSEAGYGDASAQDRLDGLPADVQEILEAAIRGGSVARPSELSATYALRYFASYLVHEKNNRLVAVGGIQTIPDALAARLQRTEIRRGSSVTAVREAPGGSWRLDVADGSAVTAAHVVVSTPSPRIAGIVDLPAWKREALDTVRTPGSTVLGVVADVGGLAPSDVAADVQVPYDDWAFVVTPGRPFDAVINPQPGAGTGLAQFVCYGNSSGYVPGANVSGSGVLEEWLEQFLLVAPGLRGRIVGARIRSWEHCFSLLTPARTAVLAQLQAPVGTMHFAGDYSSETAGTHGAYAEAERVAQEIIAALA
ncbi:NAD(P)-binding protein [Rathayibacter sp. VKM Ac-2759]|uniref:flavin monoamine oxidase family protein n=1 Tax=Rathayibacter sp. VKM Ac-2759 TaxID=2609252 RepID=UPI0013175AF3|nr:NAD(P)/FAD-dependent oxidoreductase [Rathayibacter sp. VKM Ac-2759]QHC68041.1 NAD(P)-binding protein [Rathayibacter sp. VKM Ac-2759]